MLNKNKVLQKKLQITWIIYLFSLIIASYPLQALAEKPIIETAQVVFPDNGAPKGRRRGGTSRNGDCPMMKTSAIALVPGEDRNNTSFLASTVSEYPIFWVYIPELPPKLRTGEFVLQNEEGQDIWRTNIALPQQAGVVGINLPPSPEYALEVNKKYHWYFQIYCQELQNKVEYSYVDAWIQRVTLSPTLKQILVNAKPKEYKVFSANQLWYDALKNINELRRKNPNDLDLAKDWAKLLQDINLLELSQAQVIKIYHF